MNHRIVAPSLVITAALFVSGCGAAQLAVTGSLQNQTRVVVINTLGAHTANRDDRAATSLCTQSSCTVSFREDDPTVNPVKDTWRQAGDVLQAEFVKTSVNTVRLVVSGPVSAAVGAATQVAPVLKATMTRSAWGRADWKSQRQVTPANIRAIATAVTDSALGA